MMRVINRIRFKLCQCSFPIYENKDIVLKIFMRFLDKKANLLLYHIYVSLSIDLFKDLIFRALNSVIM